MFDLYAGLLMLSGVLLIVMGATLAGQTTSGRALNIVFGVGFFGYGFYLEFLFTGGTYVIFYYAFAVPILLIIRTFKARRVAKLARTTQAMPAPQVAPAAPPIEN